MKQKTSGKCFSTTGKIDWVLKNLSKAKGKIKARAHTYLFIFNCISTLDSTVKGEEIKWQVHICSYFLAWLMCTLPFLPESLMIWFLILVIM